MDDHENIILHPKHDALPQSSDAGDPLTDRRRNRGIDGTKEEGTRHLNVLNWLLQDPRFQRINISFYVGQLWHPAILPNPTSIGGCSNRSEVGQRHAESLQWKPGVSVLAPPPVLVEPQAPGPRKGRMSATG